MWLLAVLILWLVPASVVCDTRNLNSAGNSYVKPSVFLSCYNTWTSTGDFVTITVLQVMGRGLVRTKMALWVAMEDDWQVILGTGCKAAGTRQVFSAVI
jgi:hypothetical protein